MDETNGITSIQEYIDECINNKRMALLFGEEAEVAKKWLKEAYVYAKENSDDNSTWTGALAVRDGEVISRGTNRFSPGVNKTPTRLEKPLKYDVLDHAERQCAYSAAKEGIP